MVGASIERGQFASTLTNPPLLQADAEAAEAECRGQLEEVEGRIAELEAQLALGDMKAADGRSGRGGGGGSAGGAWEGAYCKHTSKQAGLSGPSAAWQCAPAWRG